MLSKSVMREVSLSDKFDLTNGTIFITGKQALARVPLLQRELDHARGLRTAGYISGYRGSPLGTVDSELLKIADRLDAADIVFQPGLNEDLAMTAVWGSQQLDFVPGRKYDGVFAMWYGKGPGVDRSGDAIKHANMSGTHPNGGVLLAFGDDHAGKSSSLAHQSDLALAAHEVPVLYPSDVHDIFKFGLAGFAMSRECGLLAGLKLVNETADCTQAVEFSLDELAPVLEDASSGGDVGIRVEMLAVAAQDQRMVRQKLPKVHEFTRRNAIDRVAFGSKQPTRLGIVTAGKAFQDVIAGLNWIGIDDAEAQRLGIGVLKVGLIYPLDPKPLTEFAGEAGELLFVEEKRPHMELQAAALMYHLARRPNITGKRTPEGHPLLPLDQPLDSAVVAQAIAQRLLANAVTQDTALAKVQAAFENLNLRSSAWQQVEAGPLTRRPVFCSGCPHNRSTKLPEGSFGVAGIGCHGLVQFMDRNPLPCTHMGAEGVNWIGLSHFTNTKHVFVNLGDGTFSHSGSLAIRAAAASNANVTFKILANDVVAMTGGQTVESGLSAGAMVRQVLLEGVKRVVVVAEDPDAVRSEQSLPSGVEVLHRTEMENVQKKLRETSGTSVIVYVQICATEKRKRRKRGQVPAVSRHVVINPAVCEGCGDCSRASNCMSVQPLETEFGRKRRIDQASCNSDLSCLEGFCPSFVTLEGARLRKPAPLGLEEAVARLPIPRSRSRDDRTFGILMAGIGGTGVVTATAVIGMAAHLEGRGVGIYDMTGLAQKGGTVYSHLRILPSPASVAPLRLGLDDADLLVASDVVAATQLEALKTLSSSTAIVVDDQVVATQTFHENGSIDLGAERLIRSLEARSGHRPTRIPAKELAQRTHGDPIVANMILLGSAFQIGALPLSLESIEQAIRLNGADVPGTLRAFHLGRLAIAEPATVANLIADVDPPIATVPQPVTTLEEKIALRVNALRGYQDDAYADRFQRVVGLIQTAEEKAVPGSTRLTEAVAKNAFKLMAYKDEYEVARLLTEPSFWESVDARFDGGSLKLHLAPPILSARDAASGRPRKRAFSARYMLPVLRLLARFRGLRGTAFDPFGWMQERRIERRLRDQYLATLEEIATNLDASNIDAAVALACYPDDIRGYGPVKEASVVQIEPRIRVLRAKFSSSFDSQFGHTPLKSIAPHELRNR
ncbi:indolepyruvate ferredoxin oxidoreductase family protein [Bradyrhizobium canariense]|uniref:indolepyruvate ferredoxin oxidoreductase family protein n=1 Tax=Bradyrhizobium canariense TaxID=255045 RepID=UPI001C6727B2|nr:indolepyruvate ferredoxin oxidoreductase family protein [Bradyrhizobium canariense]MBW5435714.1 indolepyruvate ferredoxin oxidoreductase family protein [Bradyrhizobium canariense]